jgi:2-oxoglutarate ferredoxin oxidoreductase subunit delta
LLKGKPLIDQERCKGCMLCISACPKKILKMSNNINKQGSGYPECFDESKCIACTFCAIICPDSAIEIEVF